MVYSLSSGVPFTGMRSYQWALHVPLKYGRDYVTLILNDLDQKSRYIANMDDLLIPSSKQAYYVLLQDLLKAMTKKWAQAMPKEMSTILDYFDLYWQ